MDQGSVCQDLPRQGARRSPTERLRRRARSQVERACRSQSAHPGVRQVRLIFLLIGFRHGLKFLCRRMKRGPDGKFNDDELAQILQHATETPAGAYRARGTPSALRAVEIMGIVQGRQWGVCSMNEFRQFLGLKKFDTFEEWSTAPGVAVSPLLPSAKRNRFTDGRTLPVRMRHVSYTDTSTTWSCMLVCKPRTACSWVPDRASAVATP